MTEFKSWNSYWHFTQSVLRHTRYFRSKEDDQFLEAIRQTCKSRIEPIPKDAKLWHAQLGFDLVPHYQEDILTGDEPAPYTKDRMKPMKDRAKEGRANPKGIRFLYLSTNCETAMAEVRPWISSYISVARFITNRNLRVVNCTNDGDKIHFFMKEPPPAQREKVVWDHIDKAFSRPVSNSDDRAAYIPTQIIAELFRSEDYDGVAYRSSLGPGHSLFCCKI